MATVIVDRCPDCRAKTGDLYFHQQKQCPQRQMPREQRERERPMHLRRYVEHFRQRAEDFSDEAMRATKKNRRRALFHRDASVAAAEAIEFQRRVEESAVRTRGGTA